jgi:hypothetical protein
MTAQWPAQEGGAGHCFPFRTFATTKVLTVLRHLATFRDAIRRFAQWLWGYHTPTPPWDISGQMKPKAESDQMKASGISDLRLAT